jgi:8-oxo-dGTP pyrophosphatase MutT (NUDIX family)
MGFETFAKGPEELRDYIAERLAGGQVDFVEQMQFIRKKREDGEKYTASGVLVPLEFDSSDREYAVVLNKRSIYVQQAGDLCFPGGGTDRRLDSILSSLLAWGILPTERSEPLRKLLKSSPLEREIFLFIFASVLRESWEEMRLPPWRVEYLGGLPTIWMQSFPRVIFPVVGRIRSGWKARPNWEVESVLRVPLRAFFDPSNYRICKFVVTPPSEENQESLDWEYPCLVFNDSGGEEILWGATLRILMTFMERVFELGVEQINPTRRVLKELSPHYFSGKERRGRWRQFLRTTNASWLKPR